MLPSFLFFSLVVLLRYQKTRRIAPPPHSEMGDKNSVKPQMDWPVNIEHSHWTFENMLRFKDQKRIPASIGIETLANDGSPRLTCWICNEGRLSRQILHGRRLIDVICSVFLPVHMD